MKIGELARRTGISVRMLRYYEEQGVLSPGRRSSGYRDYDAGDLELMRMVKRLQGAGLPIATILEIMPCIIEKEMTIAECPMVIATLADAKDRIRRKIAELRLSEASLDSVIGSIGLPQKGLMRRYQIAQSVSCAREASYQQRIAAAVNRISINMEYI